MGEARATGEPPSGRGLPKLARFDVLRRIGEGGVGLVYEAVERASGARVALKMLRIAEPDTLLRLKEEFRGLADIAHPNLVRLGELLCDEGTWFFTMELVVGESFVSYVTGDGSYDPSRTVVRLDAARARAGRDRDGVPHQFDEPRLRAALAQLARGLAALHAAGKVHRDIKPSNVLVAQDGRVVILDFGLVRDAYEPHDLDGVVGTISTMAPEQAVGGEVGAPADWYAVGAVLYQCLTGRPPFQGTAGDVLRRKQSEDPRRPSELAPSVPPDLDALCMALLARDPDLRPTAADVLLRVERRASEPPLPAPAAARVRFVGRAAQLAQLDRAFARAAAGETAVVLVTGESGVGKTALVRRFTRALPASALVLAGRCYEREDVPFKAVDAVMDALAAYLGGLVPSAREPLVPPSASVVAQSFPVLARVLAAGDEPPPSRAAGRAALFDAVRELFARVARARPLVVTIDDLHWADADGLAVLAELLRPPDAPPMLFVGTARTGPGEEPGFGLPGEPERVALTRLAREEAIDLARLLLDSPGESALAKDLAAEARGHPLFLDELVRHSRLYGPRTLGAPLQLDDVLHARVAGLDRGARELLEVLAVAGVALPRDVARGAAALDAAAFAGASQALRAAHLARGLGPREAEAIEPYHDRVREAVAARLDPETRRKWHEGLARALEDSKLPDADALSTHWLGAGDADKAAAFALAAAHQAYGAFAFERAARLYDRALALGGQDERARQALRVRKADALARAGLGALSAHDFLEAARTAAPDEALDLRRRAAEELLIAGRLDDGAVILREVLAGVRIGLPATALGALASLLVYRAVLWLRGMELRPREASAPLPPRELTRHDACEGAARALALVDTIRAAYFQTRTLLFALSLGEPSRAAVALAAEAAHLAAAGPRTATQVTRLLARASAMAHRAGDAEALGVIAVASGYANHLQGRFADARDAFDRGAAALRELPAIPLSHVRAAELGAVWAVGWMGDFVGLEERVERGLRAAEVRGDLYARTTLCLGLPNLLLLRAGDAHEARTRALDATRRWSQRGYHNQHYWSLLALAQVDLYEGDGRAAYARVEREWGRLTRALLCQVQVIAVEATHLRARAALAAATDERGSVRRRRLRDAVRCAKRLERLDAPLAQPFAQLVHAGVASIVGDVERAVLHLDACVAGFDSADMALHASAARARLGALRGGAEGGALSTQAEEWMRAAGVRDAPAMTAMIAPGFRR